MKWDSINRYGHKERIVTSSQSGGAEAEERAATELKYSASPYSTPIAYRETDINRLLVTCVGRMIAANNIMVIADSALRDVSADDDLPEDDPQYTIQNTSYGEIVTVSFEIKRLIAVANYNGSWLYELDIDYNDTQTAAGVSQNIGTFDRMLELARIRNSDGDFYRLTVTNDGGVVYRTFSENVDYLRFKSPRGIERPDGRKPTWDAKPGIIKRVDSFGGVPVPDTWLSDGRLSFAERVVMRDGDKVATFHGRDIDATDIYRAQEANRRWIESRKDKRVEKQTDEKMPPPEKDIYGHFRRD